MSQSVLGFHYTLKDKDGNIIDSSAGRDPMLVLTGAQQIIPGLESQIIELAVGDKKNVVVAPKDAYGEIDPSLRLQVPRTQFPAEAELQQGAQFQGGAPGGQPRIFTIMKIEGDQVYVDGNHMLAGQELHFDIEITEKRDATADEISHGHAHGVGGHNH